MNNLKLGCDTKKVKIINTENREVRNGSQKLYLKVKANDGTTYTVNEVWVRTHNEDKTTRGLWLDLDLDGNVRPSSILGRFLSSLGIISIPELIDKEILLEPKSNGFMAVYVPND
jgi:hypothetical protein